MPLEFAPEEREVPKALKQKRPGLASFIGRYRGGWISLIGDVHHPVAHSALRLQQDVMVHTEESQKSDAEIAAILRKEEPETYEVRPPDFIRAIEPTLIHNWRVSKMKMITDDALYVERADGTGYFRQPVASNAVPPRKPKSPGGSVPPGLPLFRLSLVLRAGPRRLHPPAGPLAGLSSLARLSSNPVTRGPLAACGLVTPRSSRVQHISPCLPPARLASPRTPSPRLTPRPGAPYADASPPKASRHLAGAQLEDTVRPALTLAPPNPAAPWRVAGGTTEATMIVDRYTKTVLTIIALALTVLAVRPWMEPRSARAATP